MLRVIKESENITIDQLKEHHLIVFENPNENQIGSVQNTAKNGYEARYGNNNCLLFCSKELNAIVCAIINIGYKVYCLNYAQKWDKVPILLKHTGTITIAQLSNKFDDYYTFFKKGTKFVGMVRKSGNVYQSVTNTECISNSLTLRCVINDLLDKNYEIVAERIDS